MWRLLIFVSVLVVFALVSLFLFHSAIGVVVLATWMIVGEPAIYLWWRWRAKRIEK